MAPAILFHKLGQDHNPLVFNPALRKTCAYCHQGTVGHAISVFSVVTGAARWAPDQKGTMLRQHQL